MSMVSPFLTISVSLLLFFSPLISSQEVEDQHEFSYTPNTENGPEKWGEINKNWTICGTGHTQSPIDLLNERVEVQHYLRRLVRSYRPAKAIMKNRGHDIEVKWEGDAGSILIEGSTYSLNQLHWHSPSEHTINGRRYELEMHMVHVNSEGKIAVVGFLYEYGHPDPLLTELEPYIKKLADITEKEEEIGEVDANKIKRGSRKYYRYIGSLTTPPCTEGVIWTIVKKVNTVSKEQVDLLKEAVHDHMMDNARPVQNIYDRTIGLYRPEKIHN
ncbi:hypothetical protein LUZ60_002755 [Juncus effusus]|nr:hypothetical protein LUZ60_002755 [Juncus effusus]